MSVRYRGLFFDNSRWDGFELRAGDIVVTTPAKCGTTWTQTIWKMATEVHFVMGAACYGVSLVVWILGLSRVPVSIAYPMLSIGYVINAVAAHYLFGEAITLTRWLGIGFIVLGVWCLVRS